MYTKADQCQYGLRGESGHPQRKRTGFATNSPEIAKALSAPGDHQHEVIIGGNKSKKAQVYPEGLRTAILAAYAQSIGTEVYTTTSDQMFLENERLNSLLTVELMVDTELHPGQSHQPGPEPDRLPERILETSLCNPRAPEHELRLGDNQTKAKVFYLARPGNYMPKNNQTMAKNLRKKMVTNKENDQMHHYILSDASLWTDSSIERTSG